MNRRAMVGGMMGWAIALGVGLGSCQRSPVAELSEPQILLVSAAASLTDVLQDVGMLYEDEHPGVQVQFNFAASGALQQQIESGAPVDIFLSAANKQMDALESQGLVATETRQVIVTNQLVLVAAMGAPEVLDLADLADGAIAKIAAGEPRSVPAGDYADQALKAAGLFERLQPKLVYANSVRQVLQFVEAGNAQFGLVYATDAKLSDQVTVVQAIPADLHAPILYPGAVLQRSDRPELARDFLQFLTSDTAQQAFQGYGFITP